MAPEVTPDDLLREWPRGCAKVREMTKKVSRCFWKDM